MSGLRVLIVPDKFKGTLTSFEAASAIARGWRRKRPDDLLRLLPMSDGGDGFGKVIGSLLGARQIPITTIDAAHRPRKARWWWEEHSRTAIIESAEIIGLSLLPPGTFHPFHLDTRGLARALEAAANRGAQRCLVGIGGSGTNDGGFGVARALGWKFIGRTGGEIQAWTGLAMLAGVVPPRTRRLFERLTIAVDVRNPLLGATGATRTYGPQKGLSAPDLPAAERALRRLAKIAQESFGTDFSIIPGAGAAGGLGFGLMAFAGGRPAGGFDLFARLAGLKQAIRSADLVITGEGALDRSSFMGKGTGEIARLCATAKVPCIALAGRVAVTEPGRRMFVQSLSLDAAPVPQEAREAGQRLEWVATRTAAEFHNAAL